MNYHKGFIDIDNINEEEKNNLKIELYEKQEGLINNRAIYGDEVYILNNEVINIKKRNNKKIVGILYMDSITQYGTNSSGNPYYLFKPLNSKYSQFYVASSKKEKHKIYVVIEFKEWTEKQRLPHGQIIEYLGKVGEEENEYEMLRYYHELNYNKWKLGENELLKIKSDENQNNNEEYDYEIYSIDPEGCIDIDDAFHYKEIDIEKNKYEIGIHIASPTKYFDKYEDWIKILTERISTVYLPHKKYNLLPNELADNFCSLIKDKVRWSISIIYEYEGTELKNYYWKESKVKNRKNYTYEEVDIMIGKKFKGGDIEMKNMYKKTKEIFGLKELDSHKFVELWMIRTNEKVAEYLVNNLEDSSRTILRVCYGNNKELNENKFLEEHGLFKYMERKEMKSAEYKYYNKDEYMGHSMLGLNLYTHFTSPIRRSVDFYIHLLLLNKNIEKYDLLKINSFMKRTRKLDRDCKRMNYIFKIKKGEAESQLKGFITEITEKYIKVYIPDYELEEKIFIDDRYGYSKLKKIQFIKEAQSLEENQIIKLRIDDDNKEYNLYEEREIKVWVFVKEDNFFNKIKVEIL